VKKEDVSISSARNFRVMAAQARALADSALNATSAHNYLRLAARLEDEARKAEELAAGAAEKDE
jgi:hypothetical protein